MTALKTTARHDPGRDVRAFYNTLPFNFAGSTGEQASAVRARNQIAMYEPLDRLLRTQRPSRVLDIGCGTGWFVNSVARWYSTRARGIDFCDRAIDRAWEAAVALGVADRVDYLIADMFALPEWLREERFPVVNSLGVLHHTHDCREATRIAVSLVEPGGYVHLGLYHRYGRKPLLDRFEPIRRASAAALSGGVRRAIELQGFQLWKALHTATTGEMFSSSWYRDQCLHPHETQWTAADVLAWFEELGVEPLATSLNGFQARPDWARVVAEEQHQEDLGRTRLRDGHFFPGFFTMFGRKQ